MIHRLLFFALMFSLIFSSCKKESCGIEAVDEETGILKPKGVFSSAGATSSKVQNHAECEGILIRALWKDIEPTEGNFNFSSIDNQINAVKSSGKPYSLAILAGGLGSPDWLIDEKKAPYFDYLFRGTTPYRLPLIWDKTVLEYLNKLALELATRYKNDSSLQLVYIPQMTANGIEGHLNGFNENDFKSTGYSEVKWIEASLINSKQFATAFSNKALAFEVHELFGSEIPAQTIIDNLWQDPSLRHRVGAAMWWISGNTNYQTKLIDVLQTYPGDLYCQVIARSDNTSSFPNGDYRTVFEQAKQLKARYIEPWDFEFGLSTWDSSFHDFNLYANSLKK
jgi:hypothetical protein